MNDNRCVCCGEIIPEGRQVCYICEYSKQDNWPKTVQSELEFNEFKKELIKIMLQSGCSQEDLLLISDQLIVNSIRNNRNPKDIAFALMQ